MNFAAWGIAQLLVLLWVVSSFLPDREGAYIETPASKAAAWVFALGVPILVGLIL